MRRKLFTIAYICALLLMIGTAALYLYGRTHIEEVPLLLQKSLREKQISLTFSKIEIPTTSISFTLHEVSLSGSTLPVSLKANSASLSFTFAASWPPIALAMEVNEPVLSKPQTEKKSQQPDIGSTSPPSKMLGLLTSLLQVQLHIKDANSTDFGFSHLNISLTAKNIKLGPAGFESAAIDHDLSIEELNGMPWLMGFFWAGRTLVANNQFDTKDHKIGIGPIVVQLAAFYHLKNENWTANFKVPQTILSPDSEMLNPKVLPWLTSLSGKVSLDITASGRGTNSDSIQAKGTAQAENIQAEVNHPIIKGNIHASLDTAFTKAKTLDLKIKADADLTEAQISNEETFKKPKGVPLVLTLNGNGKDGKLSISRLTSKFHNLNAEASGLVSFVPVRTANIRFKVLPTWLDGWEKFFPKYAALKTQGTLQVDGTYEGPVDSWKEAKIELDLKAKNMLVPILQSWLPSKEMNIEGVAHLNSDSKISYANGVLKTLATKTQLDLTENSIRYSETFSKKSGVPCNADLEIVSTHSAADIKKGVVRLGGINGKLAGRIENFMSPKANMQIETNSIYLSELLSYSPTAKVNHISNINGAFSVRGNINGPLISKPGEKGADIRGEMDLKRLSLSYEAASVKKMIRLKNLSGPVSFTTNSLASKKLSFSFPGTEGSAAFTVTSFDKPNINLSLEASQFSIADFYDITKVPNAGMGVIPVPVVAKTKKADEKTVEDFRSDPLIKNLKLKGSVNIQQADLGYTKAESIVAQVDLNDLYWVINLLTIKVYEGKVTGLTEWNGRVATPKTKQNLKVEGVNANQFLTSYSEKMLDLIEGKLSTNMSLEFSGMEPSEIKKTTTGKAVFALNEGKLKTVRLTKGPLETLKAIPVIGKGITQTEWDEKINQITGQFTIADEKLTFSNLVLHSPYFDATAPSAVVGFDQSLDAKMIWTPKENLVSGESFQALKDNEGKTSLPLRIEGTVLSPTVSLDENVIESRIKAHAARKLEEEKNRAISAAKSKAEQELKKKVQDGLGNIFK